jgi:hypothetical protein
MQGMYIPCSIAFEKLPKVRLKSICRKPYPQRKFTKSEKVAETIKELSEDTRPGPYIYIYMVTFFKKAYTFLKR